MLQPILFDGILVLILAEFVGLAVLLRRSERSQLIVPLAFFLVSGAALMLALRFALSATPSERVIQALLGLSFIGHIGAIWFCWRAFR